MWVSLFVFAIPFIVSLVVHGLIIEHLYLKHYTALRFLGRFALYGLFYPIALAAGIVIVILIATAAPSMIPWSFFWIIGFVICSTACLLSWVVLYAGHLARLI